MPAGRCRTARIAAGCPSGRPVEGSMRTPDLRRRLPRWDRTAHAQEAARPAGDEKPADESADWTCRRAAPRLHVRSLSDLAHGGTRMLGTDRTKGIEAMGLADLLAGTADGGFAIDGSGRIIYWNRAAETVLGYSGREVIGRRCCDV